MQNLIHRIYRRIFGGTFAIFVGLWASEGFPLHGVSRQSRPLLGFLVGGSVFMLVELVGQRNERRQAIRARLARALEETQDAIAREQLRAALLQAHNRPLPPAPGQRPHGKAGLYAVPDEPQDRPQRNRSWVVGLIAVLVLVLAPLAHAISIHSEPSVPLPAGGLSLAQARWFVEREARKWPMSPARDMTCWKLTAATDACSFWSRSGITPAIQRTQPPRKTTELVEYTGAPIRMWLSNSGEPLTPAEVRALGLG